MINILTKKIDFEFEHSDLPALVKQRYGTELRSKTPASLKPEISQALDSLLEEIRSIADTKVLRTTASRFRQPPPRPSPKPSPQPWAPTKRPKSCPLCKQAGRNDQHFLSSCPYLPPEDRTFLSRSRFMSTFDHKDPAYMDYSPPLFTADDEYYHVPQHARSHVASVLSSHLTSKPSTSITQFSSPSTQLRKLAWSSLL